MAEYDNLLFKIDARRSEWSEDWKPVAESDIDLLTQSASALRALQTENTELREKAVEADRSARSWIRESIDLTEKLQTAERTIHEARLLSDVFGIYEKLSSYPLGEGQTPKLDPTYTEDEPWVSRLDPEPLVWRGTDLRTDMPDSTTIFKPRLEYSQNRADYEGQTPKEGKA